MNILAEAPVRLGGDGLADRRAVGAAVRRARRLYAQAFQAELVAAVTEDLRDLLRRALPAARAALARLPDGSADRLQGRVILLAAERLLKETPSGEELARLVHMRLLADSLADLTATRWAL